MDVSHNPVVGSNVAILSVGFQCLNCLILRNCQLNSDDLLDLSAANATGRLSKLRHLDMADNILTNQLSILFTHAFPRLNTLILSGCHLNDTDMRSLASARSQGRLPKAKFINVFENGLKDILELLSRDPESYRNIYWKNIVHDRRKNTGIHVAADNDCYNDTDETDSDSDDVKRFKLSREYRATMAEENLIGC